MNHPSPNLSASTSAFALRPWEGVLLALLAALVVGGIVQATHPIFRPSKDVNVAMGRPTAEFLAVIHQKDLDNQKHASLYLGCLGLLTVGALSIREAIVRRSWPALIAALPLGFGGGALGGWLGCLVLQQVRDTIGHAEIQHLVKAHLAVALPLGLGVGLGFGLATRSFSGLMKSAAGGLAAGALAGAIYPVAVSVLLPTSSTEVLLPEEAVTRFLWLTFLAVPIGLLIPLAGQHRKTSQLPGSTPAGTI
jgi:hypothetical protein